jgi:antitoxin VapB
MALYIRDPEVDALAEELKRLTKAKSKTEAVRTALEAQAQSLRRKRPIAERIARAQAIAAQIGKPDPNFDMKAFMDDLSGEP